jgi:ABC-type transport system substrate-binding protein
MVYERLFVYEQGTQRDPYNPAAVPMLATSWEYSSDGTALTFKLREGVYWGDIDDPSAQGPEVVAEDFAWLFPEYRDNSAHGGNYRTVESIEVVDKYTFIVHFTEASYWVFPYLVGKDATFVNPYLAKADRADRELVGPGPWKLVEAKKNIETRWERNPNYYMKDEIGQQLPYLDGVRFITVPDGSTRLAMLRTGKSEASMNILNTARDVQQLLKSNPDTVIMATVGTCGGFTASMNMENPVFSDANLRRAMTLGHDNKGMGEVIYGGTTCPSDNIRWFWWRDDAPTWEGDLDAMYGPYHNHYDVAKSKELLAKTGLSDVEFELSYFMYYSIMSDMVSLFAADMAAIDIKIKLKNQDYAGFNGALQTGSYPELTYAWHASGYDPVGDVQVKYQSASTSNRENINDPIVDALADDLLKAADPADQRVIVNQIRAQLNDQVYWVPGISSAVSFSTVYQPWVKGQGAGNGAGMCCYYLSDFLTHVWLDN